MKVIAFIDKKKVLAELSPEDLAGLAGFSIYNIDSKLPQNSMHYRDFNPEIVGAEIKPARIFDSIKMQCRQLILSKKRHRVFVGFL